jgi:hypothetical protein
MSNILIIKEYSRVYGTGMLVILIMGYIIESVIITMITYLMIYGKGMLVILRMGYIMESVIFTMITTTCSECGLITTLLRVI